jgi:hypothetical protein
MSSGVSAACPISCRITPRSTSISPGSKAGSARCRRSGPAPAARLLQHARVIGRDLARGVGVDIAAHILDLLGDLQGALRRAVPLKAMCSRKWAMPFCSARSWRPPALTPDARWRPIAGPAWAPPRCAGRWTGCAVRHVTRRRPPRSAPRWRQGRCRPASPARAGHQVRHARRQGGRMPVAASTASGNFAGCAVASVTIGVSPGEALRHMHADGGMRAQQLPHPPWRARSWPLVSSSDARPEAKSRAAPPARPGRCGSRPGLQLLHQLRHGAPSRP